MEADFQQTLIRCEKKELQRRYDDICDSCAYEYGHSGYTGTFAEAKGRLSIQPGTWDMDKAAEHCEDKHQKWEPAFAYDLGNGQWYVGAWCSS